MTICSKKGIVINTVWATMNKQKRRLLFAALSFWVLSIYAEQSPSALEHIKFQYYTTNEGLAQNTVDCMLKDRRGFVWFGTWNGLSKFDGYTFTNFRGEADPGGLPNNFIYTLCEDSTGNIWVGTRKGLTHYLFDENRFELPKNLEQIFSSFTINDLKIDAKNQLWVATESNGIWVIDLNTPEPGVRKVDDSLLPDRHIYCLHLGEGAILAGTSKGLGVLAINGDERSNAYPELAAELQNQTVNCIFQHRSGALWFGSNSGAFEFDTGTRRIVHYNDNPQVNSDLNHLIVTAINQDKNGTVIVGTLGGLNFFQPETHRFLHLSEREGLNSPFVNSILTDELGNVWVGTDKGGVDCYNIHQKPFFAMIHDAANNNSISQNTINSILPDNGGLWIGTAGGGLNKVSKDGQHVERFDLSRWVPGNNGANFVTTILRDPNQTLWLATWGGGLFRMQSEVDKSFRVFQHSDLEKESISNDFVSSISSLDNNYLVVGTLSGLNLFDSKKSSFLQLDAKMKLANPLEVGCLLLDSKSRLWVGTRNGLYCMQKQDVLKAGSQTEIQYRVFVNQINDTASLPGNYIISLLESDDGTIWIGTYGNGICRYQETDDGKIRFLTYDETSGLCNNVAYAMEEDVSGNIWISTDKGLSKLNPKTESFQSFYVKDGLLSDQFYWSASATDGKGMMYFGGINGLNYFDAAAIEMYAECTKPVFTEFSVFNNPVAIGQKYHSRVILPRSISVTDLVELSYKDAVFSIEFSALDYFLPGKVKYQYKMEGVDQDWVEVPDTRRFANYTNLSGGVYTFKVRAANSDGIWSDQLAQLQIIVHPPFYHTVWFRFLVAIFISLLVLAYIRYRTRFLKEQKEKLEVQVKERTLQIEAQKEELEKQAFRLQRTNLQLGERQGEIEGQKVELELQNAKIAQQRDELIEMNEKVNLVNQLRLRFFTNISHEFRTPLTLIIDPLEQLMKNLKDDKHTVSTLKLINRNAQRLLHLINQLIYFRRLENGKMDLHVCRGDLKLFLFQIYESFSDLAQHQQIDYRFEMGDSENETWFDAEKLENIFYNLLSNAFKFTPEGGFIRMSVSVVLQGGTRCLDVPHVRIEVTDSGAGIAGEHLPFIFERFYQVRSEKNSGMKSSGIGLALTHELVQALHERIDVESEVGKGSCFIVCLPFTPDRFDERELDQSLVPVAANLQGRVDVLSESLVFGDPVDEPTETDDEPTRSKPLVLIVEDNYDLRSFLIQTLRADYRLIGAENGKEALALSKKYSPDLILSDVMMPVMDGVELCSRLKKDIQTSHIPVILLTAQNMIENWIEGLESGADDYIPKPFNLDVLQARMANLIEGRRRLKKMFSNPHDISLSESISNPVDEEFMQKVYVVLEKLYQNPELSASQFASELAMSQSLLYKKLRAIADLGITDFINSFKLKKAVELIRENKLPIADIAFNVGFNDPKYFSRLFRKFYGMTPSEFQSKN